MRKPVRPHKPVRPNIPLWTKDQFDKMTDEEKAKLSTMAKTAEEFLAVQDKWFKLREGPRFNYREPKIPSAHYFLGYTGGQIKDVTAVVLLIQSHANLHPECDEIRMVFQPSGGQEFKHSVHIETLRLQLDKALETARIDWRLRELYHFESEGFHYFFTSGNNSSENWVNGGITLIFTPFGVADI